MKKMHVQKKIEPKKETHSKEESEKEIVHSSGSRKTTHFLFVCLHLFLISVKWRKRASFRFRRLLAMGELPCLLKAEMVRGLCGVRLNWGHELACAVGGGGGPDKLGVN
jgi:hypothetical protein